MFSFKYAIFCMLAGLLVRTICLMKSYVKAADYLTKEQVVETSDLHNLDAIVYINREGDKNVSI